MPISLGDRAVSCNSVAMCKPIFACVGLGPSSCTLLLFFTCLIAIYVIICDAEVQHVCVGACVPLSQSWACFGVVLLFSLIEKASMSHCLSICCELHGIDGRCMLTCGCLVICLQLRRHVHVLAMQHLCVLVSSPLCLCCIMN